jgi:4-hydroxythreonine-4-phosphate dehydrogenase
MIAVSIGDPSGIGVDNVIKAWRMRDVHKTPPFIVIADPDHIAARALMLRININITHASPENAAQFFEHGLPVFPLTNKHIDTPQIPNPRNAAGILESIDRAVEWALNKRVRAIVTCPIAKKPLYDAGFTFPGHTEYLAHLCSQYYDTLFTPVMMIAGPLLKTVPITIHIPLKDVSQKLRSSAIYHTGVIVNKSLKRYFAISSPRLAVAGLNPHAGEGGALGDEDESIIHPALIQLQQEGINAFGPLAADTLFHQHARDQYDVALCMYHDQALIPAKTLSFDDGVNVTLGLPIIRTSPDHGTAFDCAGTGRARENSFVAALHLAHKMGAVKE